MKSSAWELLFKLLGLERYWKMETWHLMTLRRNDRDKHVIFGSNIFADSFESYRLTIKSFIIRQQKRHLNKTQQVSSLEKSDL